MRGDETGNVNACLQAGITDGITLVNHERERQEVLCLLKTSPPNLHCDHAMNGENYG